MYVKSFLLRKLLKITEIQARTSLGPEDPEVTTKLVDDGR